MAYMSAASKGDWGKHYSMLAVSMLMLFSAALAKEIGITMVQLVLCPSVCAASYLHESCVTCMHRCLVVQLP